MNRARLTTVSEATALALVIGNHGRLQPTFDSIIWGADHVALELLVDVALADGHGHGLMI